MAGATTADNGEQYVEFTGEERMMKAAKFEVPPKEDWIRMVKARFAEMGNTPPTDEELDKGYERIKHEKHLRLRSGVGPIKQSDRIDE